MKLNTYKNYRVCPECGEKLPLTREYFKRLTTAYNKEAFHKICKSCEEKLYMVKNWKDGKLLCTDCGEYKDPSCFGKHADMKLRDFHNSICKDCQVKRKKQIEPNKDAALKLRQIMNQRLLGAIERATKQGLDCNITLDYLLSVWDRQKGKCALSGIPMTYERYNGRIPTNISIDKINPDLGYIEGNIQLVCMACNQIKSDLSEETMYNFCKKIVEQYENKNKKRATAA
jgi:transcription initiation factor TFIIIB Brf1 subunit/transcription initiation factor TFIIB